MAKLHSAIDYTKIEILKEKYNKYDKAIEKSLEYTYELIKLKEQYKNIDENNENYGKIKLIEEKINAYKNMLDGLDMNDIEIIGKFLEMKEQYDKCCDEIRSIEKRSKGSKNNKLETFNAEGRKKEILSSDIEYYKNQVKLKQSLASYIRTNYYKVMNLSDKRYDESVNTIEQDSNDILDIETTANNKENVVHKLEQELQETIKNSKKGKKILIKIDGQKYEIARQQKSQVLAVAYKLKQAKFEQDNNEKNQQNNSVFESEPIKSEPEPNLFQTKREFNYEEFEMYMEEKEMIEQLEIELAEVNRIISSRKSKNNIFDKIKKKAKQVVTAAAFVVVLGLGATTVFSNHNNDQSTKVEQTNDKLKGAAIDLSKITDDQLQQSTLNEVKNQQKTSDNVFAEVSIPSFVTVKDGANIYQTAKSATDEENGLKPYYDNEQQRNILGVTFNVDGQITTVYENDPDYNNKVNQMTEKGYQITSYLTAIDGQNNNFEGYYNVDDIVQSKGK